MAEKGAVRRLTLRETHVARLVAEGLSDPEIADRLAVSVVDVGAELAGIFEKLGLRSRTELAVLTPQPGTPQRDRPANPADGGL